jgi:hypothetical protein
VQFVERIWSISWYGRYFYNFVLIAENVRLGNGVRSVSTKFYFVKGRCPLVDFNLDMALPGWLNY